MSRSLWLTVLCGGLLASLQSAHGQYYGSYGGYPGGYGATTAAGSAMGGMADMTRSAGMANLFNSQANINNQAALSAELDNRKKYTETYFDMRRINKARRAEEDGPPPTAEAMFRYAKANAPSRASSSQLDPLSGQIAWTIVLQGQEFTTYRNTLNDLYATRAQRGQFTPDEYQAAQKTVAEWLDALKQRLSQYSPQDYIEGKKLLESLNYESRFALARQ